MPNILLRITCLIFIAIPLTIFSNNGTFKGRHTKEKFIKKEFQVNSDAVLKVDNKYGNLIITSWNEDRVLIEVKIQTNGDNQEKVQRKLDEITVEFINNPSLVSAKTIFDNNKSFWGWGNSNNVNMQINYTIKVPIKNNLQLENDYGSIILDRIDGHAKIDCDYGSLDIGELHGRNNQLNFDYTSKSEIGYINSGEINADYSGFTIKNAGNLIINTDYTDATILEMGNLVYDSDYGKIEVGAVNNIQGKGDYIKVTLGTVNGNLDIDADYGSLKIDKLNADAGNVLIKCNYTGVKIGYDPNFTFNFEIKTSYANVTGKDDFQFNISEVKNNSSYYKGFYGPTAAENSLKITSNYGNITFNKN